MPADFDAMFREYYDDVFRFLRGLSASEHLAEELTQETFYRAFRSIDSYRGESELRVWLCSIARNLYYSHCRKQKHLTGEDVPEDYIADSADLTELIADRELALRLHRVLHTIREPYKEVFSLRVFGELSFREIGDLFDKNEHWACVTFHRAKTMIQNEIKEESE
ncbi:MAG: RNA polymerase sigma factor [Ruminococcus sp.]|nr:RNA polymerase sigma factor [Ruminococcus sp.]MBR5166014.1 RNA polymerase sigma factor [Ruminococcus sp.]